MPTLSLLEKFICVVSYNVTKTPAGATPIFIPTFPDMVANSIIHRAKRNNTGRANVPRETARLSVGHALVWNALICVEQYRRS